MALTSASTFAEVKAAYLDNADFSEAGSVAKAKAFAQAARFLLLLLPKRSAKGNSEELEIDPSILTDQLAEAKQFIVRASTSGGAVRHLDFTDYLD